MNEELPALAAEMVEDQVAYIRLPGHPGKVDRTLIVAELIPQLQGNGVSIFLDLDQAGRIIGVEILT
jgi:hypothetical protein